MTLSCDQARERFGGYLAESLAAWERREVREHLGTCAACREAAAARDPLLAFSTARTAPVSPEETGRVLAAVRAGIALREAQERLEAPAVRRRVGALASAAAALALTLLAPGKAAYRAPSPSSVPPAEREAVKSSFVPATNPAPLPDILEKTDGTGKYPADATIYELNPGAGQPRVVWIVDRSIDI
ncbi:MAG TPA: zf-HC2 domain-containing protein [Thermoanaerobaculia bacterium]|nr:zf-HC2 domain-containing protein [Thermoanaerobaculia bacterium]